MALPNCNEGFNNSFWLLQFLREVSTILAKDKVQTSRYVYEKNALMIFAICMHSLLAVNTEQYTCESVISSEIFLYLAILFLLYPLFDFTD